MPTQGYDVPIAAAINGNFDVIIKKVENGFIVHVGCKTFVATNWPDVSDGIGLYFTSPDEARKKYCKE